MTNQPSPQQQVAIDWAANGEGNAILEAVAGAGKTTTLLNMVAALPAGKSAALVAYNKAIANEIKVSSLSVISLRKLALFTHLASRLCAAPTARSRSITTKSLTSLMNSAFLGSTKPSLSNLSVMPRTPVSAPLAPKTTLIHGATSSTITIWSLPFVKRCARAFDKNLPKN